MRGGFRSDVCGWARGVEPVEGMITVRKWKIPAQGKNPTGGFRAGLGPEGGTNFAGDENGDRGGWTRETPLAGYHGFALK